MAEAARFTYEDHEEVCKFLQNKTKHIPSIGIICGSGLGGLVDELEDKESIDYKDIPNFPVSTVPGHAGRLVFGILGDKPVVCLQGRFHFYEGYPLWKITMPVRIMKLLGVHTVFVTNAAGGINSKYNVGDFMVLKDHINIPGLAGNNPLCGPNEERFGPRFPSISDAYDKEMRKLAFTVAKELNMDSIMREGVYAAVSGPSFESPAELRFLQMVGADTVGKYSHYQL
ncbi:purine nucleoside phosphorylase-like [Saccoglossus kowalevskii]